MTLQRRYLACLNDVKAVRFTCKDCGSVFSVKPTDVRDEAYYRCLNCKVTFFDGSSENMKAIRALFAAFSGINSRLGELKCTVQFEFDQTGD